MITGKNYVGYNLMGTGTTKFRTFSPLLNKFNSWDFIEATDSEVNLAVDKAWDAFKQYRKRTPAERAMFLELIATEIELLGDKLIEVYMLESGLTESRAIAERTRTLLQLRSFAAYLKENDSMFSIHPKSTELLSKKFIPLGPVVIFGASNFPLAYSTAGGDTVSALAAGCPVIVKSHPMHAGTGELVAAAVIKAALSAGMPDGVFSNLNCADHRVGIQLVQHNSIKAVGFTGSLKGGRALFDIANRRPEPIPVFAEMGSTNPIVISEKTLSKKSAYWAEKIVESMIQSAGQFCTSPGLILAVDSADLTVFSELLTKKIESKNSDLMLGQGIKDSFSEQKAMRLAQKTISVLSDKFTNNTLDSEPTILMTSGESFINNKLLHEEVFGSFLILVKCKNQLELETIIENLDGQLTGTLLVDELEMENYSRLIESFQYRVGRLIFNGVPTGVEVSQQMNHGGPYPASTDSRFTAVGTDSIFRWLRPVCYQNWIGELFL